MQFKKNNMSSEFPEPFVHSIDPWDRHDDRDIRWKDTTH